jgi:hypothetical protein
MLAHFNGLEWYIYPEIFNNFDQFTSLVIKDDLAVVVGSSGPDAIVLIGRR